MTPGQFFANWSKLFYELFGQFAQQGFVRYVIKSIQQRLKIEVCFVTISSQGATPS